MMPSGGIGGGSVAGVRARNVRAKIIYATTLGGLESALNSWFEAAGEIELIDTILRPVGVESTALIVFYAE